MNIRIKTAKHLIRIAKQLISRDVNYSLSEKNKKTLQIFINKIIAGENIDVQGLGEFIYINVIRGQNKADDFIKNNFGWYVAKFDKIEPVYQKVVNGFSNCGTNHWKMFKTGKSEKTGKDYNYYLTINFDQLEDFKNFCVALYRLRDKIIQFSKNHNNQYIAFKTHDQLISLLQDNDTLKVYYRKQQFKDEIEKMIKQWLSENHLKTSSRAYTFGIDQNGKSFGQEKGRKIAESLIKWIKQYGNKYTAKQYIQTFQKNLFNWLKID